MFEKFKELINKLSDEEKKDFLAELLNLEKLNLITKPESLDSILTDAKFTELKKQYDVKVGNLRNEWDKKNTPTPTQTEPPKVGETDDFQEKILELLKNQSAEIESLKTGKVVNDLQVYADSKLKDLPESMRNLIKVSDKMTTEQIDTEIDNLKKVQAELTKNSTSTEVYQGGTAKIPNLELQSVIDDKKAELNIE